MKWKRPLFLLHRWLGIGLCALFALWFFSGIFMMYVEFPQLSRPERLAASQALDFSGARLAPADAVARLRAADFDTVGTPSRNRPHAVPDPNAPVQATSVRLAMLLGRPLYVVAAEGPAQPRAVFADSGQVLREVDAALALASARAFAQRAYPGRALSPRHAGVVQTDQWSVSSALDAHRPLHRIALGDAAGTELYVSSRTGEVVRDSHSRERVLNYFAAVTHWIYPTAIRRFPQAWAWLVDVLAVAGVALALSGLWVGVLRWKRRSQPGKPSIPYRGLMRWHHVAGLSFGVVALTFVFSGLLSMNPLDLNPSRTPSPAQVQVYSGKPLTPSDFARPSFADMQAVDAELMHYRGVPYYRTTLRSGEIRLVPGAATLGELPATDAMLADAARLLPTHGLRQTRVLHAFDNDYYTRKPENGTRPLPVIRVEFDDPQHTWFHLDPGTGRVIERSTRVNRIYRWLYNGLHSFDLLWLWQRRPLWDIVVIAFSLGGLALSLTGVVAGVKRLRLDLGRAARRRRPGARPGPAPSALAEPSSGPGAIRPAASRRSLIL